MNIIDYECLAFSLRQLFRVRKEYYVLKIESVERKEKEL